jgi:hypothetical protein
MLLATVWRHAAIYELYRDEISRELDDGRVLKFHTTSAVGRQAE